MIILHLSFVFLLLLLLFLLSEVLLVGVGGVVIIEAVVLTADDTSIAAISSRHVPDTVQPCKSTDAFAYVYSPHTVE